MWDTASNHLVRDRWAVNHGLLKIDGGRDVEVEEEVLEKIRKVQDLYCEKIMEGKEDGCSGVLTVFSSIRRKGISGTGMLC